MKIYLTIYLIGVLSCTCVCLVLWAISDIKDEKVSTTTAVFYKVVEITRCEDGSCIGKFQRIPPYVDQYAAPAFITLSGKCQHFFMGEILACELSKTGEYTVKGMVKRVM